MCQYCTIFEIVMQFLSGIQLLFYAYADMESSPSEGSIVEQMGESTAGGKTSECVSECADITELSLSAATALSLQYPCLLLYLTTPLQVLMLGCDIHCRECNRR